MKGVAQLGKIIEKEIRKLTYPESPELLYSPPEYIMGLQGKRMRPILVLMAHQLFDKNLKKALPPAIAIELFHNFTLLHDDIMDNASLRRGALTVHKKWNKNVAILSGDVMMIQAYQLIAKVDPNYLKVVLDVFSRAAVKVCEGQQWDMDFETQENVDLVDYIKMIEYKTAVLLAASLQIGGITGGASKEEQDHLYNFGINIGIAFQLKDDLLDVFGNPETFGKQVGGDILANKKTFLYLKALELADDLRKEELQSHYTSNNNSALKINAVKNIFKDLNVQEATSDLMNYYYKKAGTHLDAIDSENNLSLKLFVEKLMDRSV